MAISTMYDPEALGLDVVGPISRYEYRVRCPYHDDRHPSAEFNVAKGLFYCFGCHESRTAKRLASDLSGRLVPMGISTVRKHDDRGDERAWLELMSNPLALANDYLRKRRVRYDQVKKYDIRENDDGIIFPIRDKFGALTGVQIRHYDREPKYMIYGERQPLWPMDKLECTRHVFITEGVFGALRGRSAIAPTFAIMGSGSVEGAVAVLRASSIEAIAVMDNDYAGRLAAGKFVLHGVPAMVLHATDPDERAMVLHATDPDEWAISDWLFFQGNAERLITYDVNDVIDAEPMNRKLESQLKRYWRKYIR